VSESRQVGGEAGYLRDRISVKAVAWVEEE
jgi:hypothetical protein